MTNIDRKKLHVLHERESQRFVAEHPGSAALYQRAQSSLLGGVPMNWMKKWAGAFPIFVKSAKGAHFTDVDDRDYVDLCFGDTGAMTGHSPDVVAEAVARRVREGITLMLPTEDALWVGEELKRRFGLPYLAIRADRHRCKPFRDTHRSRNHAAPENSRLSLLLPWHGR